MITLDLGALSEEELKEIVFQRCAEFGTVLTVTIVKRDRDYDFALAAVDMSSPGETLTVLRKLGDSKVDNMVVIRIEQAAKPAS
ncbi:hypothetical protein D3C83_13080 [compost metagenome]